jgi:flavin reductase (DIM6/NTAB) family NADH-FMN oxidoreductase RutF
MVSVSVRESRFSYRLIHDRSEFTINIPCAEDLAAVQYCGGVSGRNVNKFEHLHLTPAACPPLVHAPMIAEFRLALGCRVKHELHLGTHHLFVADVVSVFGKEVVDRSTPRPDLFPSEQITYLEGKYWKLSALPSELPRLP